MAQTPALMILGTHSNAGKSLLATAFCRILARRGYKVAPFKAQNMSNNAGVTPEGGEMGRAQIVQAEAAGLEPHTDMNPVLLKPEADHRSQVILNGQVFGYIDSSNWFQLKQQLWREVQAAYRRLAGRYDVIVLEGAGSPAEINLKAGDMVNLRMARFANAASLLVGDIDRGGVFAALAGTMLLLEPEERALIKGFLINKFRGDVRLLGNATDVLKEKAYGVPTLGVIPYITDLYLPDEDAVPLDRVTNQPGDDDAPIDVVIPYLPHISNFDEFDPLLAEPGVQVRFVRRAEEVGQPHAIILPGSKAVVADLLWLRQQGLADAILQVRARGAAVAGVCGGYQMLGRELIDPEGLEGPRAGTFPGLGLLPTRTRFNRHKRTTRSLMRLNDGSLVAGYEIHTGETMLLDGAKPFGTIVRRGARAENAPDGAHSSDASVWGTYLHGIFENDGFRRKWLASLGWLPGSQLSARAHRQAAYERLADIVEASVDMDAILRLMHLT